MKSIRSSIVLSVLAAVGVTGVLTLGAATLLLWQRMNADFDRGLRTKAEAIASLVEPEEEDDPAPLELDDRDEALGDFQNRADPSYFELRDEFRQTVDRSIYLDAPLDVTLPERATFYTESMILPDGRRGRVGVLPIIVAQVEGTTIRPTRDADIDEMPTAWVLIASSTHEISQAIWNAVIVMSACLIGGLALLAALLPRLITRGLRPLARMARQAELIDPRAPAAQFSQDGLPAELQPIATQLDRSIVRFAETLQRERRFVSAAAHELRTPLAGIRANAELLLKYRNPQDLEPSLDAIVTSSQRLQLLINRLLQLARADDPSLLNPTRVDVKAAVEQSLDSVRPLIDKRSVTVEAKTPPSFVVETDAEVFQMLIDNLVGNAAKHAIEGSTIVIHADPASATLNIINATNGLTRDDLAVMFDPFWTKSEARASRDAGLGLALAVAYARKLGMELRPSLLGGDQFCQTILLWPTTREPAPVDRV